MSPREDVHELPDPTSREGVGSDFATEPETAQPGGLDSSKGSLGAHIDAQSVVNLRILRALRQIIRAVDLHSRYLASVYSITGPQLTCLMAIAERGPLTTSELAREVYLSPSTIVGIVDRLGREGFVVRERGKLDRRVVSLSVTPQGENFLRRAPSPLQDLFAERLQELSQDEQVTIASVIEKVAELMGAERIDAAPHLQPGDISGDLYS